MRNRFTQWQRSFEALNIIIFCLLSWISHYMWTFVNFMFTKMYKTAILLHLSGFATVIDGSENNRFQNH